jgi:hypothetical protein
MTSAPPGRDAFPYDVFVSYRHVEPDQGWVRNALLPGLKAAGLRVFIDYECFQFGRPIVTEMARGVESSRYTMAVLTPRYLESGFTDLEGVLAEHLGAEQSRLRFIPLFRERCSPRLGIRAVLGMDMSDDDQFDADIDRLSTYLKTSTDGGHDDPR